MCSSGDTAALAQLAAALDNCDGLVGVRIGKTAYGMMGDSKTQMSSVARITEATNGKNLVTLTYSYCNQTRPCDVAHKIAAVLTAACT